MVRHVFYCTVTFILLGIQPFMALASEDIRYKGMQWNSSPSQLMKKYPDFHCEKSKSRRLLCLSDTGTYYGRKADKIVVWFIDGKMKHIDVELVFSKDNSLLAVSPNPELEAKAYFAEIKKEGVRRYGKPDEPYELEKAWKIEDTTASWTTLSAELGMFVGPKEKSTNGEFVVGVLFSSSDYEKLSSEIRQSDIKKDF